MIKSPNLSVHEKARAFLRFHIKNGDWKEGARLPTFRELARQADVGGTTMLAAIRTLHKEGILTVKKKSGIYVGASIITKNPANTNYKRDKWELLKEQILKDILTGTFHQSERLPSIKELCVYYRTNFRSIKKAMVALTSDGTLLNGKPYYFVNHIKTTTSSNTVYIFINDMIRLMEMWNLERDRVNSFVLKLEQECYEKNILLKKWWYSKNEKIEGLDKNAQGFIVLCTCDEEMRLDSYGEVFNVLNKLVCYKKPISIIDMSDVNDVFIAKMVDFCKQHAIFRTGVFHNKLAGIQLGRFLLAKGHKKICFFGHSFTGRWLNRYDGVAETFHSAGISNGIVRFSFTSPNDAISKSGSKNEKLSVDISLNHIQNDLRQGITFLKSFSSTSPFRTALLEQLSSELKGLTNGLPNTMQSISIPFEKGNEHFVNTQAFIYRMQVPPFFKRQLISRVYEIMNGYNLWQTYIPFFQQALLIKDATAWVCVEDYLTNYAALQFLKSQNITIPGQIALVGFQDLFESSLDNISSYRFDFADAAIKALVCVLYPKHAEKTICIKGTRDFVVDGMVIDRGSV